MYQSRPIQQQQEIGAAAYRWMDGKESACAASAAVCTWICMCRCLFCIHEKFVGLTGRPTAQLWLREVNQCSNANKEKERKRTKDQAKRPTFGTEWIEADL